MDGSVPSDGAMSGADAATFFPCPDASGPNTPSGACAGGADCLVVLNLSCGPGVTYIPEGKPVFVCNCVSGTWQCDLQSGGSLGVILCDASAYGGPVD
jgi:hypothetical protein